MEDSGEWRPRESNYQCRQECCVCRGRDPSSGSSVPSLEKISRVSPWALNTGPFGASLCCAVAKVRCLVSCGGRWERHCPPPPGNRTNPRPKVWVGPNRPPPFRIYLLDLSFCSITRADLFTRLGLAALTLTLDPLQTPVSRGRPLLTATPTISISRAPLCVELITRPVVYSFLIALEFYR